MTEPKRQPPDLDRLDHIAQAQALIDVQPDVADSRMIALAQAHATIAIAQALRSILAANAPQAALKAVPPTPTYGKPT